MDYPNTLMQIIEPSNRMFVRWVKGQFDLLY